MGRDKALDWRFALEGAAPPVAARRDTRRVIHGRALDDSYDWIAAKNWREVLRDPDALPVDIAKLIEAENAYCERVMAPLKNLRKTLVGEMRGRIKEDDSNIKSRREVYATPKANDRPHLRKLIGKPYDPWYGAELMTPRRFAISIFNAFVRNCLCPPDDARVLGFKEIRMALDPAFFPRYLGIMQQYFPKARFIFQTRAHDEVMKSGWWPTADQKRARDMLTSADKLFETYLANNPGNCFLLRYEKYAEGSEGLRPLFEFLGEEFNAERLDPILAHQLNHFKRPPPKVSAAE